MPPTVQEPRLRPFLVLWAATAGSLLGSQAVQFALIWWLAQRTGSATLLATATLLGLLPVVVLGPLAGTLVDRWDRRRTMLWADLLMALAALALAALLALDAARPGHVLALLFLRGLAGAFHEPAALASTTLMVPERHLLRIQGMNQALEGLLNVVAAPLGALLLALWPMAGVVLVDVATALPAIVALLAIDIPQPSRGGQARGLSAVRRELADGFRYLWARPGHRTLVALSAAINACLVPAFALLPLLVVERLRGDALQLGWLTSVFGVGLLLGGLLLGVWGGTRRRIVTTLAALVALGLAVAALGLAPVGWFRFALAAMLLVGLSVPAVNGPVLAILQATVAPAYQARVFSLMGSLAGASAPVGLLLAAPVAELVGVRAWYLAGGVVCLAMAATGFLSSSLMDIERPAQDQADAVATA